MLSSAAARKVAPALAGPTAAGAPAPALYPAPAHSLLWLQRTYGNHYVQRLLRDARSDAIGGEAHRANTTGMPDGLKSGIEAQSGLSLDDVKVHYNSSEPARLHALAYAKGTNIYLGPGQVGHLPHEAWHVVQQKQGRVRGARRSHSGFKVADDPMLEREADRYGYSARRIVTGQAVCIPQYGGVTPSVDGPIQCRMGLEFETGLAVQDPHNYSYGQVLVSGTSGWEAIFDNGNLEVRTSPDDSYGSLDTTIQGVENFIALIKDRVNVAGSVTLGELAGSSPSGENAFNCISPKTVIASRFDSAGIRLVVKERTKKIESQMNKVKGNIASLVPGSERMGAEQLDAAMETLSADDRAKVEALRGAGKELRNQWKWEGFKLEDPDVLAQPQVTFGVPLGEIHLMLNKAVNTPLLAYGKQFADAGMAQAPPHLIPRPVVDSNVIRECISAVKLENEEARDNYLGFLSLVCLYVKRGMQDAFLAHGRPEYVKSYFDVMSRTDFNLMYQKLSPLAQQNFQAMGEDLVIEIVWHGDPQLDKAAIAGRNVLGLGVASGHIGPTLGQWIESIHNPGFKGSSRMRTTESKFITTSKRGKGGKAEYGTREEKIEVESKFADYFRKQYVEIDKKLARIPDVNKHLGRPLASRDMLSRGEVLYDSQSMGLLGTDEKDPAFPGKSLVMLEFRGIQGELYSRYWKQLAEQLYTEFRFSLHFGNYAFEDKPLAYKDDPDQYRMDEFLKLFLAEARADWRGTTMDPWQFWRVALTNRHFYNLLRRLFRDLTR